MKVDSIERWVKKAIRGNVDAYGELVELYKTYLYKTAWLYVRNEDMALDVVQESILKGFRQIKTLREEKYFKTWITRILINTANDMLNRQMPSVQLEQVQETASLAQDHVEEKMDLCNAIRKLPEQYQSVVILKYFNDMKLSEIAEILQIPEGSVSAYLFRAKQELRSILREGYQYA